jgi:transcriptional regulator with XRE-family HTH domain
MFDFQAPGWMRKSIYTEEYKTMLAELRRLRESSSVTQAELAIRLGITQSSLSKCERGERRIDVSELRRMCLALGTNLPDFVLKYEAAIVEQLPSEG